MQKEKHSFLGRKLCAPYHLEYDWVVVVHPVTIQPISTLLRLRYEFRNERTASLYLSPGYHLVDVFDNDFGIFLDTTLYRLYIGLKAILDIGSFRFSFIDLLSMGRTWQSQRLIEERPTDLEGQVLEPRSHLCFPPLCGMRTCCSVQLVLCRDCVWNYPWTVSMDLISNEQLILLLSMTVASELPGID
ncbi:hypothetical protein J6590_070769 [Homalodisca vitripennis]|nr:hypothetical protein J6590_070769 [Homalodisca vitripennis]